MGGSLPTCNDKTQCCYQKQSICHDHDKLPLRISTSHQETSMYVNESYPILHSSQHDAKLKNQLGNHLLLWTAFFSHPDKPTSVVQEMLDNTWSELMTTPQIQNLTIPLWQRLHQALMMTYPANFHPVPQAWLTSADLVLIRKCTGTNDDTYGPMNLPGGFLSRKKTTHPSFDNRGTVTLKKEDWNIHAETFEMHFGKPSDKRVQDALALVRAHLNLLHRSSSTSMDWHVLETQLREYNPDPSNVFHGWSALTRGLLLWFLGVCAKIGQNRILTMDEQEIKHNNTLTDVEQNLARKLYTFSMVERTQGLFRKIGKMLPQKRPHQQVL